MSFAGQAQQEVIQHHTNYKSTFPNRKINDFAKRSVLRLFASLTRGSLILRDGYELHEFGEPTATCKYVAEVDILHPSFYRHILLGGTVGSGEAFMQNTWQSPNLTRVIEVMVMNLATLTQMNKRWQRLASWLGIWKYYWQKNSKRGSKKNIAAHYDLSNDFFTLFLDPTMMYSAAVYTADTNNLHQASINKLQQICTQLELKACDHLLEIGTGWGGLAIHCARTTGCRVTTITISQAQFLYAREQVEINGLSGRVEVLLCDYRDVGGQYDKLVSIEMIEAVGHQYYAEYFQKCSSLLKPDGKMFLQAITIPHERFDEGKYKMDFIRQYIFPGGCLPSQHIIMKNISTQTDMELVQFNDITHDYARTLYDWHNAFNEKHNAVRALGFDDVFIRMWKFYLSYCEGGFRQRVIGASQWLFAKPQSNVME
ncbi:MAG: hypothetical protein RL497_1160 [Pseudomonadota bacterium]|jgi:cyclopropane-fatty-acyl-phospholipid synthase